MKVDTVRALFMLVIGAFALTGRGDLPAGYMAIDGIASTSVGHQYILTDYVPSSCNVKIEATVTLTKWATQGIWCSRMGTTDRTLTLFCWASPSYFRTDRNSNTGTYVNKGCELNIKTVLVGDYAARQFFIDGESAGDLMASGSFTPAGPLSFFASQSNGSGWGNYAEMTLHGAKVYAADGTLERDYVPVRCAANSGKSTEYGLYETVEGKYFSSGSSVGFTPVMTTDVTWSEDAAADALVLTVLGSYSLTEADAARIVGTTHANFIKRGSGLAVGMPIQDFTGNITVEEGIFRLAHRYDCGADNVGWIRVCDGATLEVRGFDGVKDPRAMTGKTVYTTGIGYGGMGVLAGGCSWNSCGGCRFILEGDSYYTADAEFNFVNYIDLAGHNLKARQANTWQRWGLSATTITNSVPEQKAEFAFVGGLLRPETMSYVRGNPTDGTVKLCSDSSTWAVAIVTYGLTSAWPLQLGPNISYSAREKPNHADVDSGTLRGPLTFAGDVKLATDVSKGLPSIVNLKGTLTGDGTTDIGTGWVNFHTTTNDYAGTVTVKRSDSLTDASHRAGIGLQSGAAYSSALTTLENADVDFVGGDVQTVNGPLCFTGDAQSRLTGGNFAGERAKLSLVRKEGPGELLLSAGVSITGRLEVAGGSVRFPSRAEHLPVFGHPGLMGSVTNEVCWSFSSPDQGNLPCVYDTLYLHGTDWTSRWEFTYPKGPRTTMARGYIWNRTDTDVTWTFRAHNNDRVWLWIDSENIFSNQKKDLAPTNVTLTPGPHAFVLITTVSNTSNGPQYVKWVSGPGSLYDALPVDFEGRGTTTMANYSQLRDPGDGSLFTVDDTRTEDLTDPFWLADIETMAFAPGTTLDVGGYDYAVGTLEGFPQVTDVGTFTIREAWLLDDAGLVAGRPMTVAGTLACGDGAVIGLKTPWAQLSAAQLMRLDAGVTIATADAFVGQPVLSDELVAAGGELTLGADGKSLVLRVPSDRYVKPVAGGVEVSYKTTLGLPAKEVRVNVYRDGVCIDHQFIGNASGKDVGTWTYTGDGYYFATATIVDESGETTKATFGDQAIFGANVRVVAEDPADGQYASIIAAVASLGEAGGKVYVREGTYYESNVTNGVDLTTPVQVIGLTDDPAKVIVARQAGDVQMRVFTLNHADAAVRMLTIQDGYLPNISDWAAGNGGNVLVGAKGGTLENCVIRNGRSNATWASGGGNVAMLAGRMSNCRLEGGYVSVDGHNTWVQVGGSLTAVQAANAVDPIIIENCLITGSGTGTTEARSGAAPVGLYGDVRFVNCTVANNLGKLAGAVGLYKRNGAVPQVVNCAFFDNRLREATETPSDLVYLKIPSHRNIDNPMTDDELAAAFVNCASEIDLNATCVKTSAPGFVDAAHGDYALTEESPLVNAGGDTSEIEGVSSRYDLQGGPRFVGGVDIGCFEYRKPHVTTAGLLFIFAFLR